MTNVSQHRGKLSHSNEAEDLLLAAIFERVLQKGDAGFYLDIGAHHPIEHSNTYLFYERGWHGVCVEPNPDFVLLYQEERPRDKFVNAGISSETGVLKYHRFDESQENGFFGEGHVANRVADNRIYLGCVDIPCLSVVEFLSSEVKDKVDLMSIDVETKEPEILAAWDWSLCRPAVICAEVHTKDIDSMMKSDVATILRPAGYTPVSRGLMSAVFISTDLL